VQDLKDGGIMGLLQTVILPSLQHEEPAVRKHAVQCLGLYCLLQEETAKSYLTLLHQVILNDEDDVKEAAMQVCLFVCVRACP
jgi:vesicle coat complex subunit